MLSCTVETDMPRKRVWRWSQRGVDNPHLALEMETREQTDTEPPKDTEAEAVETKEETPDLKKNPVNILRDKAEGRVFPGVSWCDGNYLCCSLLQSVM